jgi:hypothetical protein
MSTNSHPHDAIARAVRQRARNRCESCTRTEPQISGHLKTYRVVPDEIGPELLSNYLLLCPECRRSARGQ